MTKPEYPIKHEVRMTKRFVFRGTRPVNGSSGLIGHSGHPSSGWVVGFRISHGLTLIEALLATGLLALVSLGSLGALGGALNALRENHLKSLALTLASTDAETFRAKPWNEAPVAQSEITQSNFSFTITRTMQTIDDPYDSSAPYDDDPNDRNRVTLTVRSSVQKSTTPLATLTFERANTTATLPHCAPGVPDTTTVGQWNMKEGSGPTIADASRTGATGTLVRATWTEGRLEKSIETRFSDPSLPEYVRILVADGSPLDRISPLTLEAWVAPQSLVGTQSIVDRHYAFALWLEGGVPVAGVFDRTGGMRPVRGTSILPTTRWTHLALTYDGTTLKLWRNGVVEAQASTSAAPVEPNNFELRIGNGSVAGDLASQFRGRIDQVNISSIARTCIP